MKERIEQRIAQLKKSLEGIQNNANAHIGAIQELERLLKDEDGIQVGSETGPDTGNVSGNPS